MVYKILNDGINGSIERREKRKRRRTQIKAPKLQIQTESKFANFLTKIIKFILLIYDILSFSIYFFIQRPDKRKKEAQRTRSERINTNTWIKTAPNPNDTNYLLNGLGWSYNLSQDSRLINKPNVQAHKYMGSTLNEIFANSIKKFSSKLCLGYRAVVTCPVLTLNEEGQRILQDKSFRSDYTWYTYEQVGRRVQDLASGLYMSSVLPGSRALFLANTSLEWFIAAQSCFQLSLKLVIAPGVNDTTSLIHILKESKISIIFGSCDKLNSICSLFDSINQNNEKGEEEGDDLRRVNFEHLKTLIIIDWQFAIDFSEPIFVKLKKSSEGIIENVISMGEIEEIGVENPIELTCTKFLNEETSPLISENSIEKVSLNNSTKLVESKELSRIKDYTFERYLEVATTNSSCDSTSKEEIPNTVPMRRRSTMVAKVSPKLDINRSNRRPTTTCATTTHQIRTCDKHYVGSCYTLTNNREVDYKSSSPRLSISEQVKLSNDLSDLTIKPDDLAIIVYSLGSLGQLKAIMITHNYIARYNYYLFLDGLIRGEDIHCTNLPLDNLIELITEICVFSHGGSIGYSCNQQTLFYDGTELFEKDLSDLEALNPSFLLAKPYDLERLRSSVQNYINLKLNPLKNFILTTVLYDYKKYWAKRYFETPIVDRIFCHELKNLFGSNLKYILCNGATDCFETKDFFTLIVNIPVIEIYGPDEAIVSLISVSDIWDYKRRKKNQTESGYSFYSWKWGDRNDDDDYDNDNDELDDFKDLQLMPPRVNKNTFREDKSKNLLITSSILCPTMGTRIKLEDWEDFRTSDYPYPRGRLVIGGDVVCKGYYNNNYQDKDEDIDKTDSTTNKEDGSFYIDSNFITWFRTDDIVRVFPNGSFEIISAISDIIKMVDGQFISLSQIESIVRNSQFVENVCAICGDDRKFVIALVVPNLRRLALKSPGEANLKMAIGMEPEPEELLDIEFRREVCNDRFLCEFVDKHLNELIAKQGFQSIPSKFYLVPEIWTPETELVTPSFEPKRSAIQKYYALDIQSIFKMKLNKSKNRLSGRLLRERKSSNPNRTNGSNHPTGSRLSH